ncbi:MAG: hypothetical protein ACTSQY_09735 [Candidatus Odinarchaeia archaeon]
MRFRIRKPNIKKRIAARTSLKRNITHRMGLKMPRGYGFLRNPKRAMYNKIYNKTSFDLFELLKKFSK